MGRSAARLHHDNRLQMKIKVRFFGFYFVFRPTCTIFAAQNGNHKVKMDDYHAEKMKL